MNHLLLIVAAFLVEHVFASQPATGLQGLRILARHANAERNSRWDGRFRCHDGAALEPPTSGAAVDCDGPIALTRTVVPEDKFAVPTRRFDASNRPRIETPGIQTSVAVQARFAAAVPEGLQVQGSLAQVGPGGCRYAEVTTRGRRIAMVMAWDGKSKQARFGIDRNGDKHVVDSEVTDARVVFGEPTGAATPRARFYMANIVTIFDRSWGIQVERRDDGELHADLTTSVDYRRGAVDVAGENYTLIVVDQDDDGQFASAGDMFAFLPTRLCEKLEVLGPDNGPIYPIDEPALLGERAARLCSVDANGTFSLALEPAGDVPAYLQRRSERVLARWIRNPQHKDQLPQGHDNPGRPTIPWTHAIDASQALARARAENRMVMILWDEEYNDFARLLDVGAWRDARVVAAAAPFLCVRVNCGLDLSHSADQFDFLMGPAVTFAAPDGRALQYWDRKKPQPVRNYRQLHKRTPDEVAADLRAAFERLQKNQFEAPPRPDAKQSPAAGDDAEARKRR